MGGIQLPQLPDRRPPELGLNAGAFSDYELTEQIYEFIYFLALGTLRHVCKMLMKEAPREFQRIGDCKEMREQEVHPGEATPGLRRER